MIALALDTAEELAQAIHLTQAMHGFLWQDLSPEIRAAKVQAAKRLIKLYQVEGLAGVTVTRRES